MEIFAAYELTAAAELAGCSHDTVAKHVAARDAGRPIAERALRDRVTDRVHVEEMVDRSRRCRQTLST